MSGQWIHFFRCLKLKMDFEEGAAREAYLKIIEIIGRSSPEGKKYERELSMLLFS